MSSWKYYNHALLPTCAPHETPDLMELETGLIWKKRKKVILARWTTEYDAQIKTNWWYVIKDEPFDVNSLKSKRRYVINKGLKYFDVREINPADYVEELYSVQVDAFSAYPKKYRPVAKRKEFFCLGKFFEKNKSYKMFGAFLIETGELCGYAYVREQGVCIHLPVLKTKPQYEKIEVNAALVYGLLDYFKDRLESGSYICDGARSISHETAFQDYLEKYFGFRKAYCKLHIAYNPKTNWLIKVLFPLRRLLHLFDGIGIVHSVNAVLKMEEIARNKEG